MNRICGARVTQLKATKNAPSGSNIITILNVTFDEYRVYNPLSSWYDIHQINLRLILFKFIPFQSEPCLEGAPWMQILKRSKIFKTLI